MRKSVILFFLFLFSIQSFSQIKKWILGSPMTNASGSLNSASAGQLKFYEADFSGSVPVFTPRILGVSINSIVSAGTNEGLNMVLDSAGNIAFYVFPNCTSPFSGTTIDNTYFIAFDPITGKDEVFGSIAGVGPGASSAKNIEIVKREGYSNQYYVIYKTACININSNDYIRYVIVDMNTKTISAPVTLGSASLNEGMAVSIHNCSGNNRWLYFIKYVGGNLQLYRSSISSTLISSPLLLTTIIIPSNFSYGQGDIELSPNSDRIAISNFTSSNINQDIILFDVDLATGNVSSQRWINNPGNYIFSLEFSSDGSRLYASRSGSSAVTTEMYNIPVTSSNYTILSSDRLIGVPDGTCIEMASDGNLYFTATPYNTFLYFISNPNVDAASNIISQTAASSFGIGNAVSFSLPDQIDGSNLTTTLNPTITTTTTTICSGQSITLTGSGGTTYQWSGGISDTNAIISVSPTSNTTYYLQVSNGACIGYDTVTITVNAMPVGVVSPSTSICQGQSITLTASGGSSYQWSGGSSATTNSITVSPAVTTVYTVTPMNGLCIGVSVSDTVYVIAAPVANIVTSNDTICIGQSITLTGSGGTTYQWSGGVSDTNAVITTSPIVNTTYYLQVFNGVCSDSDSITINILSYTPALFTYESSLCNNGLFQFASNSINASYYWNFDDGTSSSIANPTHLFQEGTYSVEFITNPNTTCSDTTFQIITVLYLTPQPLLIPNIFTPNGDGLNDKFEITGLDICEQYTLEIYNRWGQKVFNTETPNLVFWDGRNGTKNEIVDGVYLYILSPKNNLNNEIIKGDITIIR